MYNSEEKRNSVDSKKKMACHNNNNNNNNNTFYLSIVNHSVWISYHPLPHAIFTCYIHYFAQFLQLSSQCYFTWFFHTFMW